MYHVFTIALPCDTAIRNLTISKILAVEDAYPVQLAIQDALLITVADPKVATAIREAVDSIHEQVQLSGAAE